MVTPKTSAIRQTLEDSWRLRLEETHARYQKATERYRRLLQEQPEGTPHDPKGALALARQAESETLEEYIRILGVFSQLTLNGKIPEEQPSATSDGL